MNVTLAFCRHDTEAALQWLEHAAKGNQTAHSLFLLPARGVDSTRHLAAAQGWQSVTLLHDDLNVRSNWTSNAENRSPSGPNAMFRQCARYFADKGPWFWCEPDAILLHPDAITRIEMEYLCAGKPYMAALIDQPIKHPTGIMVFPKEAALEKTLILPMKDKAGAEYAFDIAGARSILPKLHITNLIQHVFRAPPFASREDFDARVRKDAAIYHSCKDGSIFQYLDSVARHDAVGEPRMGSFPPHETAATESNDLKREAMLARMAKARAARGKSAPKKRRRRKRHAKA